MSNQIMILDEDAIEMIVDRISKRLETLHLGNEKSEQELLSIDEAAKLIKLTKPTIYGLVHKNKIPYSKKGKRLYFKRSELLEWIESGKRTSKSELDRRVNEYLTGKKMHSYG